MRYTWALVAVLASATAGCLTAEKTIVAGADGAAGPGNPNGLAGSDAAQGADAPGGGAGDTAVTPIPDGGGTGGTGGHDGGPGPSDAGGGSTDTGSGSTDSGGSGGADASSPQDVAPDVPAPGCPTFTISSFGLDGGPKWLHFGEQAHLSASVVADGAPTLSVAVSPPFMSAFFTDEGGGAGTFAVDQVDETFRTTEVSFTLTVADGGCQVQKTAKVKVLGNVWVTEINVDVVEIFRSDGSYLGQGIPSTHFKAGSGSGDPWSLLELSTDRIAVGSRHQDGVEVFDRHGVWQYAFDTADKDGARLYSIYGAYAMMRHAPSGKIWVGGPSEKLLVYEEDGSYVKTIHFNFQGPDAECLIPLANGHTVMCTDSTLPWELWELDEAGEIIGGYGDNSGTVKLSIHRGAMAASGQLVFGGSVGAIGSSFLVLLKPAGQLTKQSPPIQGWKPQYGITPLGDGFLVATGQTGSNDMSLARFDANLDLVTDAWTDRTGNYRGIMVLGGN